MRIGIVVDSGCDLPADFIAQHNITLLPITARIGEALLADHRDEQATLAFLNSHVAERAAEAETIPFTVQQIRDLFLEKLVIDYDHVFCLTISSTRSAVHANAMQASFAILNDYKPARNAAGFNSPFALRVIDSQNLFAAQAVSAAEAVRLRDAGMNLQQIRERLEAIIPNVHGYLVPRDLYYMRARARHKGDRSVSLFSAALGSALDIKPVIHSRGGNTAPAAKIKGFGPACERLFDFARARVSAGLLSPTLCVSYGGELDELHGLSGYQALAAHCQASGVALLESVMSLTGMINVGKGAVTLAFADDKAPIFQ
jgi:DegV family protein with EDD domain